VPNRELIFQNYRSKSCILTADIPEINENSVIVTSARHYDALMAGKESIERVSAGIEG
jgi:hypothetical protein